MNISETNLLSQLRTLLHGQDAIVAAYLFGSTAQGKAHQQSDIDIAILFRESLAPDEIFQRILRLGTLLESHCSRPIDLVALNRTPPLLRFQVIKTGTLLLENDHDARALFQMRAMLTYYDVKPYLDYQQSQLVRRIREQGLGHGYQGHRNALTEVRKLRQTFTF